MCGAAFPIKNLLKWMLHCQSRAIIQYQDCQREVNYCWNILRVMINLKPRSLFVAIETYLFQDDKPETFLLV